MSKKIKAIQCPHCGSTKVRETRPDYYKCTACATEFFLDNDDININHHYVGDDNNLLTKRNIKYFAIAIAVLCLFALPSFFGTHVRPDDSPMPTYQSVEPEPEIEEEFMCEHIMPFETKEGRAAVAAFGTYTKGNYKSKTSEYQMQVYDMLKNEKIKVLTLPLKTLDNISSRTFENGWINVVFNKNAWYTIDPGTLDLKEMDIYKTVPGLESGFASIELLSEGESDGFKVMTNLAKERYYLPIIKKIYTQPELFHASHRSLPKPTVRTDFDFSVSTTEYPEQQIELVKYTHYVQVGWPKTDVWSFGWCRDFGEKAGLFFGNAGSVKAFISSFDRKAARLISYSNFTPGALYFSPSVLWSNESFVFIRYKPTPSKDATYVYQLLDAKTAKLKWSLHEPADFANAYIKYVTHTPQGLILTSYNKAWMIDNNGKSVIVKNF